MNESEGANVVHPRTDLSDTEVNLICDVIRECGYGLHIYFGPGFREKVYERGLIHRMKKQGLRRRRCAVARVSESRQISPRPSDQFRSPEVLPQEICDVIIFVREATIKSLCHAIRLCLFCFFVASKTAIARAFGSCHKETQDTQKRTETASFLRISMQPRLNVSPYRFLSCDSFVSFVTFRGQQNRDCACLCF